MLSSLDPNFTSVESLDDSRYPLVIKSKAGACKEKSEVTDESSKILEGVEVIKDPVALDKILPGSSNGKTSHVCVNIEVIGTP